MKSQFIEYYNLPEDCINKIWDESLIIFDTNVLLNLYRYNKDSCNEFIKAIEFYKERLWIPYQVGLEFHKRREEIIRKNAAAYKLLGEKLSEQLIKVVDTLKSDNCFSRHPYINMNDIKKKVTKCASSITKSLEKQSISHPDYYKNDYILDAITKLYEGHVGNDFSEDKLNSLYEEGKHRYENLIPPGYCDEKNKKNNGNRSLYGDLIVWKQTIIHCSEQKKDAIFVTDDHKQDWWDKIDGKHTPRKELIKEFINNTGQNILIYDSSRFLEHANKNKDLKISHKTIKEVSKIKFSDIRNIQDYLNKFQDESMWFLQSKPYFDMFKPTDPSIDLKSNYKGYDDILNTYTKFKNTLNPVNDLRQKMDDIINLIHPYNFEKE